MLWWTSELNYNRPTGPSVSTVPSESIDVRSTGHTMSEFLTWLQLSYFSLQTLLIFCGCWS
jgi:hypothetical protein